LAGAATCDRRHRRRARHRHARLRGGDGALARRPGLRRGAFATEYGQEDDELPGDVAAAAAAAERAAGHVAETIGDAEAAAIVVPPDDVPVDDAGA